MTLGRNRYNGQGVFTIKEKPAVRALDQSEALNFCDKWRVGEQEELLIVVVGYIFMKL